MELDESGNITKLFGVGPKNVGFYGSTGYNNGVYLLNDICKSRYGNASLGATAQAKMNPNGRTQSENVYTATTPDTSETASTALTCTQTYYGMRSPSSYFDDSNFYNMIFGTETHFWLASRYVSCYSNNPNAYFGLRDVSSSELGGYGLFNSDDGNYDGYGRLAPVVSLGSGIQVKSGSGTTDDPYIFGK